jgi:hypothetical protein
MDVNGLDEKVGYLIAKIEEQGADLKAAVVKLDALEQRVDEKFKTAEATFRVLKGIGLLVVAVLTFKFGDISLIKWF